MIDPKITFSLPEELNKMVKEYCKKYHYGQGEFLRNLIRSKFYTQAPTVLPAVKSCSICRLPKKEDSVQRVEYTVGGKRTEGLVCFDCFETLPHDMQQNYHPL